MLMLPLLVSLPQFFFSFLLYYFTVSGGWLLPSVEFLLFHANQGSISKKNGAGRSRTDATGAMSCSLPCRSPRFSFQTR